MTGWSSHFRFGRDILICEELFTWSCSPGPVSPSAMSSPAASNKRALATSREVDRDVESQRISPYGDASPKRAKGPSFQAFESSEGLNGAVKRKPPSFRVVAAVVKAARRFSGETRDLCTAQCVCFETKHLHVHFG